MNTLKSLRNLVIWGLVLLMAMPLQVFAQDGRAADRKFSQQELDQLLAPIALYPDSLLGHVFIAATYPLEVVMAERWARENRNLSAEQMNEALKKQPWDASVKALVPFPDVLSMMSQKLDWTQKVGDAFLGQQAEVMDTVQNLRKRAHDAGNLKSTEQQKVVVEQEVIRIEPASPSVVYVPVYDPWWVYGPWWWPYYPPYVVYPYPAGIAIAPGFIWFGVGLTVGAFWGTWGYWNWGGHGCYVRPYPPPPHGPPGSGAVGGAWATRQPGAPGAGGTTGGAWASQQRGAAGAVAGAQPWQHNAAHRRGVAYRDQATRERYGQQASRAAVESRRNFRGYDGNWIERGARAGRPETSSVASARPGASGRMDTGAAGRTSRPDSTTVSRTGRPEMTGSRDSVSGRRPDTTGRRDSVSTRTGRSDAGISRVEAGRQPQDRATGRSMERSRSGQVFEGVGRGGEVRRQSNWGRESLGAARSGGATVGEVIRGSAGGAAARSGSSAGFGGAVPRGSVGGGFGGGASPGGFGGGAGGGMTRGGHR